nr:MAG TPA: hypothetical protein [Caudoviricetes sp.]
MLKHRYLQCCLPPFTIDCIILYYIKNRFVKRFLCCGI